MTAHDDLPADLHAALFSATTDLAALLARATDSDLERLAAALRAELGRRSGGDHQELCDDCCQALAELDAGYAMCCTVDELMAMLDWDEDSEEELCSKCEGDGGSGDAPDSPDTEDVPDAPDSEDSGEPRS